MNIGGYTMRYRLIGILGVIAAITIAGLFALYGGDTDPRTDKTPPIAVVDRPYTNSSKSVNGSAVVARFDAAKPSLPATMSPHDPTIDPSLDPLLNGVIGAGPPIIMARDPSYLYRKLRGEERDKDWSAKTEQALLGQLRAIPYVDKNVRVICGSTLCEIAGFTDLHASLANTNYAMGKLQMPELLTSGGQDSFDPVKLSVAFGSSKSNPSANTFVRYAFRKSDRAAPRT